MQGCAPCTSAAPAVRCRCRVGHPAAFGPPTSPTEWLCTEFVLSTPLSRDLLAQEAVPRSVSIKTLLSCKRRLFNAARSHTSSEKRQRGKNRRRYHAIVRSQSCVYCVLTFLYSPGMELISVESRRYCLFLATGVHFGVAKKAGVVISVSACWDAVSLATL